MEVSVAVVHLISGCVVNWAAKLGERVEHGNLQQMAYPTSREDRERFVVLSMDHNRFALEPPVYTG